MRTFAIIAAVGTASALELSVDSLTSTTVSVTEKFSTFKSRFAKVYKDAAEELHALENFIGNEKIIVESNAQGKTYTLGHNQFSDLSWAEFKKLYLSSPMPVREQKNVDLSLLSAPRPPSCLCRYGRTELRRCTVWCRATLPPAAQCKQHAGFVEEQMGGNGAAR